MTTSQIQVHLPLFEGPLALLLYLIRKEEMDILDIEIHKITEQYLNYLKMMKEMDLEVAGDFVAMAATLIQIKSEMLLPQMVSSEEGEIPIDPRRPLVERLLEYQQFQAAAKELGERPWLGREVFARGNPERLEETSEEVIEENLLFRLIAQFRLVTKRQLARVHHVAKKIQSVASRIFELKSLLPIGVKVPLRSLLTATEERRKQLLITFLSVLEMAKMGFVQLFQTDTYQEIYVEALRDLNEIQVSQVEEFDQPQGVTNGSN